jgi:hypothetical protein
MMCEVTLGSVRTEHYFDIANIDHYDAILGIPFMSLHDVRIAPGPRSVTIAADETVPLVSSEGGRSGHSKMVRKNPKPVRKAPVVPAASIAAGRTFRNDSPQHSFRGYNA